MADADRSVSFVLQYCPYIVLPSARKHGIGDNEIRHAIENAMVISDQDDGTCLYIGPGHDARLLEIVTAPFRNGAEAVIHAMALRRKYRWLLEGQL